MSDRCIQAELEDTANKSVLTLLVYPETIVLVQESGLSTCKVWIREDCLVEDGKQDKWILLDDLHAMRFY